MRLRPLEPEDLDLLYSITNDAELWSTTDDVAPYSRYALKRYIANAASIHESGELRLIIEADTEEGKRGIGMIDLTDYIPLHARAQIGIAILKEFRGKGYGSQAVREIERLAVERLRIHQLYAIVAPDNTPSYQMFANGGYSRSATLPRWIYEAGEYKDMALLTKFFSKKNG